MKKLTFHRPSAAMSVAFLALLAALSGTSVALPGKNNVDSGDIRNGQVKSSDIKNSTVRGADIARNTVRGADVSEGSLGTVPSATTAERAGTAASAGTAGTAGTAGFATRAGAAGPHAYARVSDGGDVDPALSKNVTTANVTTPANGVTCFNLPFNPKSTIATLELQGQDDEIISVLDADSPNAATFLTCPAGTEVQVHSTDAGDGMLDNDPFYIQFNL